MATVSFPVELGFVEKRAPWKLRSKYFVNKVGGYPAWLRLNNLPHGSDLLCKKCCKPLVFLMQVYAPIHEIESAFHRTIFLFTCKNGECCAPNDNKTFVVYRSQLPRQNDFYPFEPPKETSPDPSAEKYQPICCVCGCAASLKCSKCSEADYCSKDHRDSDWKWTHQNACGKNNAAKQRNPTNWFLLPEFGLKSKIEELPPTEPEKSDEEKMKEYQQYMQSPNAPTEMQDLDDSDLISKKDKVFNKFQKRMNLYEKQVLRYHIGETPLWVSAEHIPSPKGIPDCVCGAERVFEFQVMPQLLWELSLYDIDWGILAVYTCSESCERGAEGYVEEFLWKQDISE